MDGDRKYGQRGYQENDRFNGNGRREDGRDGRRDDRPQGPRPPLDITGPRLPRMVQSIAASRCWNCSTMLLSDMDFKGKCLKCNADLHCCKQCSFFEPSTRFQCIKPVLERVNKKDIANECTFFKSRVTVARDTDMSNARNGSAYGGGFGLLPSAGSHNAGSHNGGSHNGGSHNGGSHNGGSPDSGSPDSSSPNGGRPNRDSSFGGATSSSSGNSPKNAQDARAAFDSLFKK